MEKKSEKRSRFQRLVKYCKLFKVEDKEMTLKVGLEKIKIALHTRVQQ